CVQLQRQQLHDRDRRPSAGPRVRFVAQLIRSTITLPLSKRECKIDGRLRAPVFLCATRKAAALAISSGTEYSGLSMQWAREAEMRARQAALAIVFALSATAYAQPASVTLYGRLNLDVEVVNGKQGGDGCPENCPNPNQYRVSSNASMFG